MMKYIACDKDPDFEKYLADNSESCSKVKTLYQKVKSFQHCAFNIPKAIVSGALKKLGGQQLNQETNVQMLKEYLPFDPETKSQDIADLGLKENFEFFQFVHLAETTRLAPEDTVSVDLEIVSWPGGGSWEALQSEFKDVDVDHAKRMLELTRLRYPKDETMAVRMALDDRYREVNVDHAKRMLELTRLRYPEDEGMAMLMALKNQYKYIDVDHAKRVLELTRLGYPKDEVKAMRMALYKEVNVDHAKRMLELTRLWHPKEKDMAMMMALDNKYKDVNVDHAKRMFELTRIGWPKDNNVAVWKAITLSNQYKDVDVNHAKRMLKLTRILKPNVYLPYMAVEEALTLAAKYKTIDVDKVYEKYQDLKNFWWFWFTSEQELMKKAFKLTHPEVVKEDF